MSGGPAERGSVLMLVPAGVLVLFVLGSLTVDHAIAFLAQRQLTAAAAGAANDAATAAVSEEGFYGGGAAGAPRVAIDPRAAEAVVDRALAARPAPGLSGLSRRVEVSASGRQVCVTLTARVGYLFARGVPGAAREAVVTGRAVATAAEGDGGRAEVPRRTLCE